MGAHAGNCNDNCNHASNPDAGCSVSLDRVPFSSALQGGVVSGTPGPHAKARTAVLPVTRTRRAVRISQGYPRPDTCRVTMTAIHHFEVDGLWVSAGAWRRRSSSAIDSARCASLRTTRTSVWIGTRRHPTASRRVASGRSTARRPRSACCSCKSLWRCEGHHRGAGFGNRGRCCHPGGTRTTAGSRRHWQGAGFLVRVGRADPAQTVLARAGECAAASRLAQRPSGRCRSTPPRWLRRSHGRQDHGRHGGSHCQRRR
jgi:hypothetical protein